jgi:hypothetical protein
MSAPQRSHFMASSLVLVGVFSSAELIGVTMNRGGSVLEGESTPAL